MTLHLVRHGRPLIGPGPRSKWPLDPAHVGEIVGLRDSDVIPEPALWYSSPEIRAVETIRVLCDRVPLIANSLREQDRPDEWFEDIQGLVEQSLRFPERSPAPDWEPAQSVGDRLMTFVSKLSSETDVVLVGHGTAWTILVARLTGTEPDVTAWKSMGFPDHCSIRDRGVVSEWSSWTSAT